MSEPETDVGPGHTSIYLKIFIALAVLTVLTWGVAYIKWDNMGLAWLGIVVAFSIAALKATLVVLFFMHMKTEIKPMYILVAVPLLLAAILVLFLMPDIGLNEEPIHPARLEAKAEPGHNH